MFKCYFLHESINSKSIMILMENYFSTFDVSSKKKKEKKKVRISISTHFASRRI